MCVISDPDVDHRKSVLALLRSAGKELSNIDPCYTRDPDIVLAAVESNPMAVCLASKELLDDHYFALEVVHRQWRALAFLATKFREDPEIVWVASRQSSAAISLALPAALHALEDLGQPAHPGYKGEYVRLVGYFNDWRTTDSNVRFKKITESMTDSVVVKRILDGARNVAEVHHLTVCLESGSVSFQIVSCTRKFDFRVFPRQAGPDGFFRLTSGDTVGMPVNVGGKNTGHGCNFLIEETPGTVVTIFVKIPRGFRGLSLDGNAAVWYNAEYTLKGELTDNHQIPILTQSLDRQKPVQLRTKTIKIANELVEIDKVKILQDIEKDPAMKPLVFQARKISEDTFCDRFRIRDLKGQRHLTVMVDIERKHVLGYMYYWLAEENSLWLDNFALRKRCRSMGLGQALAHWLLDQAKKEGCSVVRALALNKVAGFYERLGFHALSSFGSQESVIEVEFFL